MGMYDAEKNRMEERTWNRSFEWIDQTFAMGSKHFGNDGRSTLTEKDDFVPI